jgi:AraC-like DNA-binding protein
MLENEKYYISKIDVYPDTIYCHHGPFDESFIPTHKHDKGQFLYTEGGIVFVKTNNQTFYLPARHYIWIPPNVEHSIHPSTEKAIMRNIYFPIKEENKYSQTTKIYPVNDLIKNLIDYSEDLEGDIKPDTKDFTIMNAFFYLLEKYSSFSLPLALPLPQEERLKEIITYLSDNLGKKIKLPEISKQFGISLRSMTRLFSKQLNMTFVEYLTILRILKALELLLETNKSISEICSDIGYTSVPTFSNVFQKMIGVRPAEYRKVKGF